MITHLSQSMMGMWGRCQVQFWYRYLDGLIVPPGIAPRIGAGVHKGAEHSNRAKLTQEKREPKGVVVQAAVQGYEDALSKEGVHIPPTLAATKSKIIGQGKDQVAALTELYYDDVDPGIDPVAVEKRFEHQPDGLSLPFVGIVDWVQRGIESWSDIKTSKSRWSQSKANASIQATLYPRLIGEEYGQMPTRLRFDVLIKTKKPTYQPVETTRTREDWAILLRRANLMLSQIRAGIFQPADPDSWVCSSIWCGYFYLCPHISARRKIIPKKKEEDS